MYAGGYIDFEWDDRKAEANEVKHAVSFEEAADAFFDPHARVVADAAHSQEEERFFLMGISLAPRVLTVCYCERRGGLSIRIISARAATRTEEKAYWRYRHEDG